MVPVFPQQNSIMTNPQGSQKMTQQFSMYKFSSFPGKKSQADRKHSGGI